MEEVLGAVTLKTSAFGGFLVKIRDPLADSAAHLVHVLGTTPRDVSKESLLPMEGGRIEFGHNEPERHQILLAVKGTEQTLTSASNLQTRTSPS